MSYSYTLESLLLALHPSNPTKVNAITASRRSVEHGLLSVGLKLHYSGDLEPFKPLIEELGGAESVLEINYYRRENATFCWVLPPVGNAKTAVWLLECIGEATGQPIFDSRSMQIQVCSPGRLSGTRSAMLAIAFYLGSDVIRRYTMGDFKTTYSRLNTDSLIKKWERGTRLVLYEGPGGDFDPDFAWWRRRYSNGRLQRKEQLPSNLAYGRTDTLTALTRVDIRNINFISTLLCHAQYDGCWRALGREFEEKLRDILREHLLDELLFASWIHTDEATEEGDREFMLALSQLASYAYDDTFRIRREARNANRRPGILAQVKMLLDDLRSRLVVESRQLQEEHRL